MNQDGILNILDLVTWVDRFLSTTPDAGNQEQLFSQYPEMDINNDGIINILDLIVLVNMILENNRTNSNIISRIEKQLDRLLLMGNLSYDDIKKIEEAKKTTNLKQTFIDEILQKQKNG